MNDDRIVVSEYIFRFDVTRDQGRIGGLYLVPTTINTYDDRNWQSYLVVLDIVMEHYERQTKTTDFLCIGTIRDIMETLIAFRQGPAEGLKVTTVEPGFECRIEWCDIGKDVKFTCSLPAMYENSRLLVQDPRVYRNTIFIRETFEFYIEPSGLDGAIANMRAFLDFCQATFDGKTQTENANGEKTQTGTS